MSLVVLVASGICAQFHGVYIYQRGKQCFGFIDGSEKARAPPLMRQIILGCLSVVDFFIA